LLDIEIHDRLDTEVDMKMVGYVGFIQTEGTPYVVDRDREEIAFRPCSE